MNPNRIIEDNKIFYGGVPDTFTITPEIREAIKNLKHSYYEGDYVDKGLLWTLNDNMEILKRFCPSDMKFEVFLNHIAIAKQFIVRTLRMEHLSPEYIQEHNIQFYHINLINRLYIDYESWGVDPEIHTADKRPFGNSYMIGDVAEEMGISTEKSEDLLMKVYHEVLDLTLHTFKEMPIPFSTWCFVGDVYGTRKIKPMTDLQEKYHNHSWTIDISEHRDKIIDEIIK